MQEKKLAKKALIRYEKGRQNKAPVYEMIPLNNSVDH